MLVSAISDWKRGQKCWLAQFPTVNMGKESRLETFPTVNGGKNAI